MQSVRLIKVHDWWHLYNQTSKRKIHDHAQTLDCVCDVDAGRNTLFLASALNGNADILVVEASILACLKWRLLRFIL